MQRSAKTFKDVHGLHARIDTFLGQSSVLRVGLVPSGSRNQTANVLPALIDEPVQKTNWSEAVRTRPLAKDVSVTQSSAFTYVETQNSLMVYPVPFPGPPAEYLEVNSITDSWDHVKTCHLLLFSRNEETHNDAPKVEFPSLLVVDAQTSSIPQNYRSASGFAGEQVWVDSTKTLKANALLQKSPANASQYMTMRSESNIAALQNFDRKRIYEALKRSIFTTCEKQIAELPPTERQQTVSNELSRQKWSNSAHRELQGSISPGIRNLLANDFAFYKLYARSDDIEPVSTPVLESAMPESRANFQFLLGQVSQKLQDGNESPRKVSKEQQLAVETLVESLASKSLTSVSTASSIQLPIAAVSVVGHFLGGFSWYSMTGLALLGVVSGLRRLQTDWSRATKKFESQVADLFVDEIQKKEQQLWSVGEQSSHEVEAQRVHMTNVLREVKNAYKQKAEEPEKSEVYRD